MSESNAGELLGALKLVKARAFVQAIAEGSTDDTDIGRAREALVLIDGFITRPAVDKKEGA